MAQCICRRFRGDAWKLGKDAGMHRPAGACGEHQVLPGYRFLCCDREIPLVELTVMRATQGNEVVQAGLAAIGPVFYMMRIHIS